MPICRLNNLLCSRMLRLMMWNSLLLLLGTCSRFAIKNKILKLKKNNTDNNNNNNNNRNSNKNSNNNNDKSMKIKEKANQGISLMVI